MEQISPLFQKSSAAEAQKGYILVCGKMVKTVNGEKNKLIMSNFTFYLNYFKSRLLQRTVRVYMWERDKTVSGEN